MSADLDSVLSERLQTGNKQEAIELYYELLSSGHSVGEILESLDHVRCKSEHDSLTTAERPPLAVAGAASGVTSEAALEGVAQKETRRSPGASPVGTEPYRAEEARALEAAPLSQHGSGVREQVSGETLPRSEPNIVESASVHASVGSETAAPSDDQKPLQPGRFSTSAERITFGAVCIVAIASASIASFAIVSGDRNAEPGIVRTQSGMSSGTEAGTVPGSAAGRSETVVEIPRPNKQPVNASASPAPEPSRSAEPGSTVLGPVEREATEMPPISSASTAHSDRATEPVRQEQVSAVNNYDAVGSGTGLPGGVPVPMAEETRGQQMVQAFYTALERGNGEAASLFVIPEKRQTGPFSAGELSKFYSRLEQPFHLIGIYRAGENLYDALYSYKARNGQFCKGRSLVKTISLGGQVLIEKIQSLSRC